MGRGETEFVLLIDHDNVPVALSFQAILDAWLAHVQHFSDLPAIVDVSIRAYGGWYEEGYTSPARYAGAEFYQERCPAVLRVESRYLRLSFSFADELHLGPDASQGVGGSVRITHTVGTRRTKKDLSFTRAAASCHVEGCQVHALRRWSRNARACTLPSCPHEFAVVAKRREQKQVDVHLSVDLMLVVSSSPAAHPFVAVVSDDIDLLPAIVAAAAISGSPQKIALIRHQNRPSYQDGLLTGRNVAILNISSEVTKQ